jgi:hypothetical protein
VGKKKKETKTDIYLRGEREGEKEGRRLLHEIPEEFDFSS